MEQRRAADLGASLTGSADQEEEADWLRQPKILYRTDVQQLQQNMQEYEKRSRQERSGASGNQQESNKLKRVRVCIQRSKVNP